MIIKLGLINNTGYKNLNWVQRVRTNISIDGKKSPYIDNSAGEGTPFYAFGYNLSLLTNKGGYDMRFEDSPSRLSNTNVYWQASLTLVGVIGNTYYPLVNINYGFEINQGHFTVNPITFSTPIIPSVSWNSAHPEKY